jgi:hypothetical protein
LLVIHFEWFISSLFTASFTHSFLPTLPTNLDLYRLLPSLHQRILGRLDANANAKAKGKPTPPLGASTPRLSNVEATATVPLF